MRLCLLFYKQICILTIGISLLSCVILWQASSIYFVVVPLLGKLLTNVLIGVYLLLFEPGQFIFYHNLGYPKYKLLAIVFALDFSAWLVLTSFTIYVKA